VRIAADVTHGHGWLRWLGPLGWTEQVHPVTGARPAVLLLFAGAAFVIVGVAAGIAVRRDIGSGLFRRHDARRSRSFLLGSPTQAAVRGDLIPLAVWIAGGGLFAVVLGAFAKSIADETRRSGLHTLGLPLTTATGYLSVVFSLFAFLTALFAVTHVGGMRDEEGSGRLETLLALPVGRRGWLAGRLAAAGAATAVLALAMGVLAWIGAAATASGVSLGGLLAAGGNCLPVSLLFLGVGVLAFAASPRSSPGLMLTIVSVAFLWQLVGALVSAPSWLLAASPFDFVAAVPERAFDAVGAGAMLAVAVACGVAALALFGRRDLQTG
jgi:polyether ionophore transport system permease protein